MSLLKVKATKIFVGVFKVTDEIAGFGSVSQRNGSADPDSYQNVTDPKHCLHLMNLYSIFGTKQWMKLRYP
jgi:hypothetical protein